MSLINVNIINMHPGSGRGPQPPAPRPPESRSGGKIPELLAGIMLTWLSEPWMQPVRDWLVAVLTAGGVPPDAAPVYAIFISITLVCAAPAGLVWLLRKILK